MERSNNNRVHPNPIHLLSRDDVVKWLSICQFINCLVFDKYIHKRSLRKYAVKYFLLGPVQQVLQRYKDLQDVGTYNLKSNV